MNIQKVRYVIQLYKEHFVDIHQKEIYKWRAVKTFQDSWDIEADDFFGMLERSLSECKNLLVSRDYYPERMLLKNVQVNPEYFRQLFVQLLNEKNSLLDRIVNFRSSAIEHSRMTFPDFANDYQDHRAILVYLSLRFPNRYYFYKFQMFQKFGALVDYQYAPKIGSNDNVLQFINLCNLVRAEILKDNELLKLHKNRIGENEYFDASYNILTQDVIYAAVKHFEVFEIDCIESPVLDRLIKVENIFHPKLGKIEFKGRFTNYFENEREKKRIGDLGELLVFEYEQEKLKLLGIKLTPVHKSKSEGDGLGYDILSYDEQGNEIFIEVKTTIGGANSAFYITAPELERSKKEGKQFILYRLYNYDDLLNSAKFISRCGSLTELCINPILYRVNCNI
jgi:hypothetical protein